MANGDHTTYQSDAQAVPRDPRARPRDAEPREVAPPTTGERLTRRRRTVDPLYFDQRIVPAGFSYEWKCDDVMGQPNTAHMIGVRENHWVPVPAARHPELAYQGDTQIRRPGLVLMQRPKYLTDEAQMEDLGEALKPVQQMDQLMYGTKPGELTRDHPSVRQASKVRQQWSPGAPPDEGDGGLSAEP
jgi:hypothetical protein